jgi:hypothetical protein
MTLWQTIGTALFSSFVGALWTAWHYRRAEQRKIRIDTLRRFYANRFDILGDEFSRALNEIFVVFNASPKVLSALQSYQAAVAANQQSEDALISLGKAMCSDLSIDTSAFNDSFFLRPFNTRSAKLPLAALQR